jgi:outer membrane protein
MRFPITGVAVCLLALFTTTASQAQNISIGYADPEVIITYMPEYQTIQQQMAAEYRTSQEALQALAEDFQDRVAKYQKQQPLLSAERQAEREAELAAYQQEIQQSAAQKDQELTAKQEELMAPLLARVQTVIDDLSAEMGLDLVIRSPALLFVNESKIKNMNIDIAKKLGVEIDEGTAAAK